MVVYKLLCCIKLVTVIIGTAEYVLNAMPSKSDGQKSISNRNFDEYSNEDWIARVSSRNRSEEKILTTESPKPTRTLEIVFQILYAVLEIYIYACIKSLYFEIEDETKPKGTEVVINHHQQPVTSQGHQPHYIASLHPVQPPHSPGFHPQNSPVHRPYSPAAQQLNSPARSPNQPGCSNVTIIPLHARNR